MAILKTRWTILRSEEVKNVLGFFPKIHDDELMYSVFARYHVQSGNTVIKYTTNDLFGTKSAYATADFPSYLGYLYEEVKHFNGPNVTDWINKHSMYNYYTNFSPLKSRQIVYDSMVNHARQSTIQTKVGLTTSVVKPFLYFRYCPKCLEEDLKTYGETYWRMTLQLPSTFICLKHDELIVKSDVLIREKNKHEYIQGTTDNCRSLKSTLKTTDKSKYWLKVISEETQKLATIPYAFKLDELEFKYHTILQARGYKTIKGHTDHQKLSSDFEVFFGLEVLDLLQSRVDKDNPNCWLKSIARKHRKGFHPIRHILIILFLGETLGTILKGSKIVYSPFGEKPYLCLNKACPHYKNPVIEEVKITRCSDTKQPVGTFECSCGFIYSRRGPDMEESDKFKIGRIKAFGPKWKKKLEEYIINEKKSYRETARLLNVDTNTVIKYAKLPESNPHQYNSEKLKTKFSYRQKWSTLREEHSNLSKTELRKLDKATYIFLYRHDKEWLDKNSPEKNNVVYVNERVDWDERDQAIQEALQNTVEKLLNEEKPVRLTVSRLGKAIQKLSLLEKKLDKMPISKTYLEGIIESVDEFQIRRVHWAVQELNKKNEEIVEWKVMRIGGLKPNIADVVRQEVQQVVINNSLK